MEQSIAEAEPSSEDHRRNMHLVWQELGVGREGYLTLEELASVCERIGMEEMNGEVRVAVEMRETVESHFCPPAYAGRDLVIPTVCLCFRPSETLFCGPHISSKCLILIFNHGFNS